MTVAVIGASRDRDKFGNKAVRAYSARGYDVYPVHPHESKIEGIRTYARVTDIPVDLDVVLVYLHPEVTYQILDDIAAKGAGTLFLNPGSADDAVVARARDLGLEPTLACSIVAIGESPSSYR